ncbi:MAG: recombinase family protein [Bdellovibrionia bacterium]
MLIGYARISTQDQSLNLQTDALSQAGCQEIFQDVISGAKSQRDGLDKLLKYARNGDTVVVWKLDRLGRSLKHLIELVQIFDEKKIGFKSLQENIDTTTASGKLFLHLFGALAEFEKELIRERTLAGLRAAADRGRKGGRPRLMDAGKIQQARALHLSKIPILEICRTLGISKGTLYRSL